MHCVNLMRKVLFSFCLPLDASSPPTGCPNNLESSPWWFGVAVTTVNLFRAEDFYCSSCAWLMTNACYKTKKSIGSCFLFLSPSGFLLVLLSLCLPSLSLFVCALVVIPQGYSSVSMCVLKWHSSVIENPWNVIVVCT